MPSPKREKFLEEVMSYIKFPFDRADIRFELESHILDKINYYTEQGYDKETAEQLAINDMGDVKEIGVELNKQHKPIIGWLWAITNIMVVIFIILNLCLYGTFFLVSLFSSNPIDDISNSDIIYKIDFNEKVQLDDVIIHFTNIVYEKNGEMNIFYEYYDTKLWGMGWSFNNIGEILDDQGNTYLVGSRYRGGGIKSKCRRTVENFSKEAERLIINYDNYNRKFRVEIPLKAGVKNV